MTRLPNRRLLALALATAMYSSAFAQAADPATPSPTSRDANALQSAPQTPPAPLADQSLASSQSTFVVSDIRVDGLQRIGAGTVFTYLPIERGDTVDQNRIGEAIRALYKTGFFEDVRIGRQGDILVIAVTERPAINKLTLVGNKDIKTEDLTKGLTEIGLTEGGTFDRLSLDRVTQELRRQYNNRGKYNVEINPNVSRLDRNRVDITINITEGKAAKIQHINLIGNEKYEQENILRSWESQEHNWLSWYKRDDQYSREKLSGDLEKLNNFYLDRGYVDASIDSTQVSISPDKRDMYITAGLTEGEQYKISAVEISGDTVLPKEVVEKMVIVKPGQIFSRAWLELSSDAITASLGNIGYAFAKVNPIPDVDREKRTVAVNLQVIPGPRVIVRRVVFKGNGRTADEVMRREMRQFEDSWYSQAAIDRSKVRLQRLGYFETVDVETTPVAGSNDLADVVYTVKETTSGSFVFGLGYSQVSKVNASIQLSQNNFLGSGNRISVQAQRSRFQESYGFSFLNPYFTDEGLSLGYNLLWRETDYSEYNAAEYNTKNISGQVVLGLPITENDTVSAMFGLDRNQILARDENSPLSIVDYIKAIGQRSFHSARTELAWARDTRNDYFTPTRGTYQRISGEMTLPGSTVEYYKLNYDFSRYWPISRALVLNTRAELGYGDSYGDPISRNICFTADRLEDTDGDAATPPIFIPGADPSDPCLPTSPDYDATLVADGLPFFENFYAGGTRSVRGFRDNTLGPRERSLFDRYPRPIGGAVKTIGSLEMYFPTLLDTPAARISAFVDFGTVFKDVDAFAAKEFRISTGVALLWRAPVGPITISYALPIQKDNDVYGGSGELLREGDEVERLQFTFGGAF